MLWCFIGFALVFIGLHCFALVCLGLPWFSCILHWCCRTGFALVCIDVVLVCVGFGFVCIGLSLVLHGLGQNFENLPKFGWNLVEIPQNC